MVRYNSVECLHLRLSLLGICFLTSYSKTQSIPNLQVKIPQGSLQGRIWTTLHKRNISAFQRIPYAQPPIGNLRFANPVAADGWSGIRNASEPANPCPQRPISAVVGKEDCLHLDVYTPQLPENTNSSLLPVMVFIHGGGFVQGGPTIDAQDPHYLLDKDVLLVLPNYRLGPLGFLTTGDEVASGNWGLKDMILALKWVQNNIKYFGGNPDQVTLFGGSTGGVMVHLLTLLEATKGLFHQYIIQSGSALAGVAHRPRTKYAEQAFQLGEYVGCFNDSSDSLIDCLRTVDASELIATTPRFRVFSIYPKSVWGPTDEPDIKGAVLTDSPKNLLAAGKIHDLPSITGLTQDEGLAVTAEHYDNETLLYELLENFDFLLPVICNWVYKPDSGAAWLDAAKSYYFNNDLTGNASVILPQLTLLIGDALFTYPTYSALRKQSALSEKPLYFYLFNYLGTVSSTFVYSGGSTKQYGVAHGDEMNYLFLREVYYAGFEGKMSDEDYEMVDIMVQLWTSFATNGIPTSSTFKNSTIWSRYSSADNYLQIGNGSDIMLKMRYPFFTERMQFWADLEAAESTSRPSSALSALNSIFIVLFCLVITLLNIGTL